MDGRSGQHYVITLVDNVWEEIPMMYDVNFPNVMMQEILYETLNPFNRIYLTNKNGRRVVRGCT